MRGYRGILGFALGATVAGVCAAVSIGLGYIHATHDASSGYDVLPHAEIEVPDAPSLWNNGSADSPSTQIAADGLREEFADNPLETGVRSLQQHSDHGDHVKQVAYDEPPLSEGSLGADITSSPAEAPANPLRRDIQGFVLPEEYVVEGARTTAAVPSSAPPRSSELTIQLPGTALIDDIELRESQQSPVARTASRQSVDHLPPPQTNAIREILRKENSVSATAAPPQAAKTSGMKLAWREPKSLLEALEKLAKDKSTRAWAEPAWKLTLQLGEEVAADSPKAKATLSKLDSVAAEAVSFAEKLENATAARRVRQAGFALRRRLDIWRELPPLAEAVDAIGPARSYDKLETCLAEFEATTANSREGLAWRQYLLTELMRENLKGNASADALRQIAQESLRRLGRAEMSAEQKRFLAIASVAALRAELSRVASGPVDLDAILTNLEQYEQTLAPSDARRLAETCRALDFTPDAGQERLDRCLETHYRNANLRLAVSEKLLNRLMPQRPTETAPVYDNVMGMDVYGESITTSRLAVKLLPSPDRVRLAVEVTGTVNSFTTSSAGPATFHNNGTAVYTAFKPMEIDIRGIRMEPTQIDVHNDIRLQNLETNFDRIPLVNLAAKGIAQQKYEQSRPEAAREMRGKVAATARQRVDSETTARLQQFAANFNKNVLHPINTLELQPVIVAAETTSDRFLMRLRLAGEDQLGSHTPRPQAPSDSLASVQIHESAINNALMRLDLDGKTFSLPELSRHIATKFERLEAIDVNPENEDVSIEFAARDAIQVRCDEGQIVLTLAIAKLSKGSRAWKDFQVRANYRPQIEGRKAELARDGVIHLTGKRLNTGAQIALRGIFSKTFSRKTPWVLTPEAMMKNPALADQAITQFTIDDGWIGAALGPKPTVVTRPAILHR